MVDKHDCSSALLITSRSMLLQWGGEHEDRVSTAEVWHMVQAAFLLRDSFSFRKLTQKMILNTHPKLSPLRKTNEAAGAIPGRLLGADNYKIL